MNQASLLAILLIIVPSLSHAQHRKVPIEHDEEAYMSPGNHVKPPKPVSYTRVTFDNNSGHFDTSKLEIVKYSTDGKLLQTDEYEYLSDKEFIEPPFDGVRTDIGQGKRLVYAYDNQGRIKSSKEYIVLPANSAIAIWAQVEKETAKQGPTHNNDTKEYDQGKEMERSIKVFTDAIAKGVPEKVILKEETRYDADGNKIYTDEVENSNKSRYIYTYGPSRRVIKQREIYYRGEHDKIGGAGIYETRYSYINGDKLNGADTYYMGNDTNHIPDDGTLTEFENYSYNYLGKPSIIIFQKDGMEYIHRLSYADTMVEEYTVLTSRTTDMVPKLDTSSITTYRYDKNGNRIAIHCIYFYDGRRSSSIVYEISYNKDGLPVEVRRHTADYGEIESLAGQSLFLYGTLDDKETLDRSLSYRRPARVLRHKAAPVEQKVMLDAPVEEALAPVAYDGPVSALPQQHPVFTYVEQAPAFKGDINAYISQHLKYPTAAKKAGVEGKVVVRFIVTSTGNVTNVEVVKSLSSVCDEEALRLVSAMPPWIPGKQNGMSVDVYYSLPITFSLHK